MIKFVCIGVCAAVAAHWLQGTVAGLSWWPAFLVGGIGGLAIGASK